LGKASKFTLEFDFYLFRIQFTVSFSLTETYCKNIITIFFKFDWRQKTNSNNKKTTYSLSSAKHLKTEKTKEHFCFVFFCTIFLHFAPRSKTFICHAIDKQKNNHYFTYIYVARYIRPNSNLFPYFTTYQFIPTFPPLKRINSTKYQKWCNIRS
jgi:hypothetical protein